MKKILIVFFSSLIFVSCTTTNQVQNNLLVSFDGNNADSFFLRFGMPTARFKLQNGFTLYRWSSGTTNFQMPAFTTFSGNIDGLGNYSGSSTTFGNTSLRLECVIDITTNDKNIIRSIRIVRDTMGLWAVSRCAEVLNM